MIVNISSIKDNYQLKVIAGDTIFLLNKDDASKENCPLAIKNIKLGWRSSSIDLIINPYKIGIRNANTETSQTTKS